MNRESIYKVGLPVGVILFAIIIVIALTTFRPTTEPKAPREKIWSVQVSTVKLTKTKPSVVLFGKSESQQSSNLTSAVDAYVIKTAVREGDRVKKGQLLVQLDPSEAELTFKQRQGDVQSLKAQIAAENARYNADKISLEHEKQLVTLSERNVERLQKLFKRRHASEAELDTTREKLRRQELSLTTRELAISDHPNRLSRLRAQLQSAQATESRAKLDLDRTKIVAPFNGRVSKLTVAVGDRVRSGGKILQVYDTSALEIRGEIPKQYVGETYDAISHKRPITATLDNNGKNIDLQLDRLAAEVESGRSGVEGLFKVVTKNANIPVGKTFEIIMQLPHLEQVAILPAQSLYGLNKVYKVENNRLVGISVQRVGNKYSKSGEPEILVKSPKLKNGDKIIFTQLPNAITGLKVKISQ